MAGLTGFEAGRTIVEPLFTAAGIPIREAITRAVRDGSETVAKANGFGVSIVDVRIKRLNFPQATGENIFNRMRTERAVQAQRLRAEGEELFLTLAADVDKLIAIILAEAEGEASTIAAEGHAEVVDVFLDALQQAPGLAKYRIALEAYKVSGFPFAG